MRVISISDKGPDVVVAPVLSSCPNVSLSLIVNTIMTLSTVAMMMSSSTLPWKYFSSTVALTTLLSSSCSGDAALMIQGQVQVQWVELLIYKSYKWRHELHDSGRAEERQAWDLHHCSPDDDGDVIWGLADEGWGLFHLDLSSTTKRSPGLSVGVWVDPADGLKGWSWFAVVCLQWIQFKFDLNQKVNPPRSELLAICSTLMLPLAFIAFKTFLLSHVVLPVLTWWMTDLFLLGRFVLLTGPVNL